MKVVKKKLTELKRPEKNIRLHPEKQLIELERSVAMFGQIRPIIVDEDGVVLAGNGLFETLERMGRKEADCYVVTGLSETEKKKLMLADNRIFDLGVDDMAAFDEFILELKDDLDVPGFDEDMLRSLTMDFDEADDLIADYGLITQDKTEEIIATGARYEERDEKLAQDAIEHTPLSQEEVTQEIREAIGYEKAYEAEEVENRYILCPKCGERIWL